MAEVTGKVGSVVVHVVGEALAARGLVVASKAVLSAGLATVVGSQEECGFALSAVLCVVLLTVLTVVSALSTAAIDFGVAEDAMDAVGVVSARQAERAAERAGVVDQVVCVDAVGADCSVGAGGALHRTLQTLVDTLAQV